jgi:hypothetical protein
MKIIKILPGSTLYFTDYFKTHSPQKGECVFYFMDLAISSISPCVM